MVVTKHACKYAIVRFTPHVETGEFANIGVLLVAPKSGYLDFRVETRRQARINAFFDTLEPGFYRGVVATLVRELTRISKYAKTDSNDQLRLQLSSSEPVEYLFEEITRSREGMINFSETRSLLSHDPEKSLDELFGYYVDRNFVTQKYRETVLEDRMKSWLSDWNLTEKFSRRQFDDGVYRATFPFVENDVFGNARTVLKPFFLGQKDPTAIIDHGVKWRTSVARLRRGGLLPKRILFAVEGPDRTDSAHLSAYGETIEALRNDDIDVVPFEHKEEIQAYIKQ